MPSAAGHDTRLVYLWEDENSFNQDAEESLTDTEHKTFGANISVNTLEGSNNALRVFGNPNKREATDIIEQSFDGSVSVEFTLTNPWWIQAILGPLSSDGGTSAPYTHTPDSDMPKTMRIIQGTEATGNERTLTGVFFTSAEISVSTGGEVTVSMEGAYANENENSPGAEGLVSQVETSKRPMMFHQASLSLNGTTQRLVQNVSVSIENNVDGIEELGTRFLVDYSPKVRSTTLSYGDIVDDDSELTRMYGGSTSPQQTVTQSDSVTLTFDNGGTGGATNRLSIDLSLAFPNSYGRSGIADPESDIEGDISDMVGQITCTAENDTSTAK